MSITIRPAHGTDVPHILSLVNGYAADNIMLPRTEANVRQTLVDWLVAVDDSDDAPPLTGCGALVPLTEELVEIRSLAIHASQQGKGLGGQLVMSLIQMARERDYRQVCALTLREGFFTRLGFGLVDRWSISPKVWQACIYCPKFHRCDEVAVLMDLTPVSAVAQEKQRQRTAWNSLLKWNEWQPLKLAYNVKSDHATSEIEEATGVDS